MHIDDLALLRDLDRIRDQTLELSELGLRLCDYLTRVVGFDEAHLLVRDPETGGLANTTPHRPLSDDISDYLRRGEQAGWEPLPADENVFGLPLIPRSQDLGMLLVRSLDPLAPGARRIAELAASVIDSALEHALTHAQLKRRNRELEAVFALDRLRDEHLPFDRMIERALGKILEFITADSAAVVLVNSATGLVDIRLPAGATRLGLEQPACLKSMKALAARAFELRSLVSAVQLHPAIGAALCVPLILDQDIIGAFEVFRTADHPFGDHERRLLSAMASQIDTAIFEDMQRQRIKEVFTRYVAADVVEEMLKTDCDFFAGQRRELSVLFSDLRGFTATSEQLDTDTLVSMLNQHFAAMTEVILRNRGTLDKFIGDCVMAFWGAPVHQPDHARLAVKTAVEMRAAHAQLIDDWRARGLPAIELGIAINSGDMFVGNIGDERKSSYTVIGDNVNLASRLEGVAAGGEVLITERTRALVGEKVETQAKAPVRVKGKSDPIPIWSVLGLS